MKLLKKAEAETMITGLKFSYKAGIFFVGITAVLFMKAHSEKSSLPSSQQNIESDNRSNAEDNPDSNHAQLSLTDKNTTPVGARKAEIDLNCDPLPKNYEYEELSDILSCDILAQTDVLNYIIVKTMKIPKNSLPFVKSVLDKDIAEKILPKYYIPYANLLSSFLRCWIHFANADRFVKVIRQQRSANEDGFDSLLREVSSSVELSELFSRDILSDPESPTRLFHKFLDMPNDVITNLRIQLTNFRQKWWRKHPRDVPFSVQYVWYANNLFQLLLEENALENLKRDMVEIQRKSTSDARTANLMDPK